MRVRKETFRTHGQNDMKLPKGQMSAEYKILLLYTFYGKSQRGNEKFIITRNDR